MATLKSYKRKRTDDDENSALINDADQREKLREFGIRGIPSKKVFAELEVANKGKKRVLVHTPSGKEVGQFSAAGKPIARQPTLPELSKQLEYQKKQAHIAIATSAVKSQMKELQQLSRQAKQDPALYSSLINAMDVNVKAPVPFITPPVVGHQRGLTPGIAPISYTPIRQVGGIHEKTGAAHTILHTLLAMQPGPHDHVVHFGLTTPSTTLDGETVNYVMAVVDPNTRKGRYSRFMCDEDTQTVHGKVSRATNSMPLVGHEDQTDSSSPSVFSSMSLVGRHWIEQSADSMPVIAVHHNTAFDNEYGNYTQEFFKLPKILKSALKTATSLATPFAEVAGMVLGGPAGAAVAAAVVPTVAGVAGAILG